MEAGKRLLPGKKKKVEEEVNEEGRMNIEEEKRPLPCPKFDSRGVKVAKEEEREGVECSPVGERKTLAVKKK